MRQHSRLFAFLLTVARIEEMAAEPNRSIRTVDKTVANQCRQCRQKPR
jgi:hypothetical protein